MIRTAVSGTVLAMALASAAQAQTTAPAAPTPTTPATVASADAFVADAEKTLAEKSLPAQQIAWVNATYITDDTDALAAASGAEMTDLAVRYGLGAARYQALPGLSYDTKRKLDLLRGGITLPAPTTPGASAQLSMLTTRMSSSYGKGKGLLDGKPINGSDIEAAMGSERDPARLKEMWVSWHDNVGAPMRADYAQMTTLANQGAKELGYADAGALWRSGYDMSPEQFAQLTDKIWGELEPLYKALHTYVRWKLNEKYGDAVQAKSGPIRADLLGNMWAQEWGNIYDVVAPRAPAMSDMTPASC
ncbi:Angiotensin-converting enzyme [Sphingomonas paucimobilis]|nr:Angiotensin-converting enzyme [Sphingomonas paucimobilis]